MAFFLYFTFCMPALSNTYTRRYLCRFRHVHSPSLAARI
mgnify:CR=1 FL=1